MGVTESDCKQLFTKDENYQLLNENISFYDLWTCKESFVKLVGKGLSIPFNSFTVIFNDEYPYIHYDSTIYYCKQYEFDTGYKIACCSVRTRFPKKIIVLNERKINKKINCSMITQS